MLTLSFKMHQPTPDVTEIHLNIEDCDPDGITIGVFNGEVQVEASAIVHITLGPSGPTQRLSRPVTTTIPLAPGIRSDMIHSSIDDGAGAHHSLEVSFQHTSWMNF